MREYEFYIYIVRCSDGSYYTGVTNSVARRVAEHNEGGDPKAYTFKRRPVTLVYCEFYQYIADAIAAEKIIKRWSRKKKEALINEEYERLPELARTQNYSQYLAPKAVRYRRYRIRYLLGVMVRQGSP